MWPPGSPRCSEDRTTTPPGTAGTRTCSTEHRDLGITADQRARWVQQIAAAADDAGLPDDPEFRAAFVGYVEWGTRLAMGNSQPGAPVVEQAPVPRWG